MTEAKRDNRPEGSALFAAEMIGNFGKAMHLSQIAAEAGFQVVRHETATMRTPTSYAVFQRFDVSRPA